MNKIKITVYSLSILLIALVTQIVVNNVFRDEGRITDAFSSTKSKAEESKLEIVVDYGKKYLSEEDKKNLIDYFASALELTQDYEVEYKAGNTSTAAIAEKKGKNADTRIEVISVEKEDKKDIKKVQQYILITLTIHENTSDIMEYKKILEKSVSKLDAVDYQSMVLLSGIYSGNLEMDERNQVTNRLLYSLQAKIADENRDEEVYTIYAYTGLIKEYIKVEGKKVNINVAMSYDEVKDETLICLASPILNTDF